MLIEQPKFVYAAAAITVAAFAYFVYMSLGGDSRFADGALDMSEATWGELALIFAMLLSVFLTWLSAIWHALRSGQPKLALLIVFVWPASFVYAVRRLRTAAPQP